MCGGTARRLCKRFGAHDPVGEAGGTGPADPAVLRHLQRARQDVRSQGGRPRGQPGVRTEGEPEPRRHQAVSSGAPLPSLSLLAPAARHITAHRPRKAAIKLAEFVASHT